MPIQARTVYYIKLGAGGGLENLCLADGTLRLVYREVPESLARSGTKQAISDFFLTKRITRSKSTASIHAGIIRTFFDAGDDDLWITFSNGLVYWCFAKSGVEYLGIDGAETRGCFCRLSRSQWKSKSVSGQDLRISELNGELTKVSAFRMAICKLKAEQARYLIAKINGDELPEVREAKKARAHLEDVIPSLLRKLSWKDFELLVDLIFSRSGWRRISGLGGSKKTTDIDLVLPTTGARAFVQVKAQTDRAQLEEYVSRFKLYERADTSSSNSYSFFYVYHTSVRPIEYPSAEVTIWGPREVSRMVVDSGLTDWLIQKVG